MIGAIDIGGTKIAVAAVDRNGAVLASEKCATEPERGFDDAIGRMSKLLRRCLVDRLEGIGIGCTGPVDPMRGWVGHVPFLSGWAEGDLAGRLAAEFSVPVALENDADAHALGEYDWGAGRGSRRFIMVTVGTGIGGGIILDGELYRGAGGTHPEMGHHIIDAGAGDCSCGAQGCWESLASGPALAAWYQARRPTQPPLDARAICAGAESGEPLARAAVERMGRYLGLGLANLVTLFVPDRIALGGGLMKSGHLFRKQLEAALSSNCRLIPDGITRLVDSQLGGQAGVVGAASIWLHRFERNSPSS